MIFSICVVTSTSSQLILVCNRTVDAPVNQDSFKMEGTRGPPLEPYLWQQHSSANLSPKQRSCRALSRLRALPVLPMALLLPTRRQLLASPVAADMIINLFVLEQMCLVAATNALLSASRVQAGLPGAGRNKAVAHRMCSDLRVCTSMCPLNQEKKTAGKVYTGMYSVHTTIYFIWEFYTEIYRHILSYTYNRISRHIRLAKSISPYIWRYTLFGAQECCKPRACPPTQ